MSYLSPSVIGMDIDVVTCACGRACDEGDCETLPVFDLPLVPSVRDGWQRPDEVAEWVRVNGAVDALFEPLSATVHSGALSARGRVDALAALEQYKAAVDAAQLRLIATMAADDPDGKQWAQEDVAAALRLSPRSAGNRMALAEAATTRFPAMAKLLEAGRVTLAQMRSLDEHTAKLADEQASLVESMVLDHAQRQTVGEFTRTVKRKVLRVDASSAEQRHQLARADRRVSMRPADDGMAELWWLLPADQAAHIVATVDAIAGGKQPDEIRSADQRRSDALYSLITHDAPTRPHRNANHCQANVHPQLPTRRPSDEQLFCLAAAASGAPPCRHACGLIALPLATERSIGSREIRIA